MTVRPERAGYTSRTSAGGARYREPAACLLLLSGAFLVPDGLRPVAVVAGFGAGFLFAHTLRARTAQPFDLRALRGAVVGGSRAIGIPYLLAALVAMGAALAVLLIPIDKGGETGKAATRPPPPSEPPPQVDVVRETLNEPFRARGVAFHVSMPSGAAWAQDVRRRNAGRGQRWVLLSVRARNVSARGFDPNRLAYRLRDARGTLYAPAVSGGTGPASLGETGELERGRTGESRLAFQVPRSARSLALLFEPRLGSATQLEVSLSERR